MERKRRQRLLAIAAGTGMSALIIYVVLFSKGFWATHAQVDSNALLRDITNANAEVRSAKGEDRHARAEAVWNLLDATVLDELRKDKELNVQKINRVLAVRLRTGRDAEERLGWSIEVNLRASAAADGFVLGTYEYFYWATSMVSTFRTFRLGEGRWQVVGRMEQTGFIKEVEPGHRKYLSNRLAEQTSPGTQPDSNQENVQAFVSNPIDSTQISIPGSSIRRADSGVRFVTIHSTRGRVTAQTAVQWVWQPEARLRAVAWIWADGWQYDPKTDQDTAVWQGQPFAEKTARLKDLLR